MAVACVSLTKKGRRCTIPADPGSAYCHLHRPDGTYQLQQQGRRGGGQLGLDLVADPGDVGDVRPAARRPAPRGTANSRGAGPDTGVFTDGSCSPNPGPGGWGFVWVVDGTIMREGSGDHPDTTNNRMELTALIEALRVLPADAEVTVYSDSNLCVQTLTQWAPTWERKGWPSDKKNLDLVRPALELVRARPGCRLQWIKAHVGYRWNEYADGLATTWMRR